jgi:uncharacterized protein (TIGR02145 family)
MFYQWNRKVAWAATGNATNWDSSTPEGDTWEKANDPSPAGWRVPTLDEIRTLLCDKDKVSNEWTIENGIKGIRFTDKNSGNSVFLPAAGSYSYSGIERASEIGYYWSSTALEKFEDLAFYLHFIDLDDLDFDDDFDGNFEFSDTGLGPRRYGSSIRCIAE